MHLHTAAGRPLMIALDSNPGGGWLWQAPPAPAGCHLADADVARAGAGEGGAVQQRFAFSSAQAGTYTLRFVQRRAWASELQAVQPVHITVA